MLQLERLSVASETLKQLAEEMRNGKFDGAEEVLLTTAFGCQFYANRVYNLVHKKIHDPEAFENENS